MIEAKPVIPNQYWILREHDRKVGNIEAESGGYILSLNGTTIKFQNLDSIRERVGVAFRSLPDSAPPAHTYHVNGYPTTSMPYNSTFDVKYQLPLWTCEPRSKSWLAAGWYRVQQHHNWQLILCPKRILLERYKFHGPYRSHEEAMNT